MVGRAWAAVVKGLAVVVKGLEEVAKVLEEVAKERALLERALLVELAGAVVEALEAAAQGEERWGMGLWALDTLARWCM